LLSFTYTATGARFGSARLTAQSDTIYLCFTSWAVSDHCAAVASHALLGGLALDSGTEHTDRPIIRSAFKEGTRCNMIRSEAYTTQHTACARESLPCWPSGS
jgi:hypothetical protein